MGVCAFFVTPKKPAFTQHFDCLTNTARKSAWNSHNHKHPIRVHFKTYSQTHFHVFGLHTCTRKLREKMVIRPLPCIICVTPAHCEFYFFDLGCFFVDSFLVDGTVQDPGSTPTPTPVPVLCNASAFDQSIADSSVAVTTGIPCPGPGSGLVWVSASGVF